MKEKLGISNILITVEEEEGDSFFIQFNTVDTKKKLKSPKIFFDNIAQLESLAKYIIGLAKELQEQK